MGSTSQYHWILRAGPKCLYSINLLFLHRNLEYSLNFVQYNFYNVDTRVGLILLLALVTWERWSCFLVYIQCQDTKSLSMYIVHFFLFSGLDFLCCLCTINVFFVFKLTTPSLNVYWHYCLLNWPIGQFHLQYWHIF